MLSILRDSLSKSIVYRQLILDAETNKKGRYWSHAYGGGIRTSKGQQWRKAF